MNLPDRQLLDASPDGMVVVDSRGEIVLVNKQTETLFGYSRDELLTKPVELLLPERFRDHHPKHREHFVHAPRVRSMGEDLELYGRCKDGTEFPVEISLSPVNVEQEFLVAATIRDATKHAQLRKSLTGILETSINEIFVFDIATLRFVQVNECARKNLGYTMEELRDLTPVDIKPFYNEEQFAEIVDPLRRGDERAIQFESVHERKDGSRYPVEIFLQRAKYESKDAFVAIILDITERKQSEQALLESHQMLEQRVIERTAELEEANAGKSRFLAAASHDLRQPLQSMGLYLSVLMQRLNDTAQTDIGEKMRNSLDTMGELLDALLDISKLDGGSVQPDKRDFRLAEILDRIVTDNIQQAREKGLQFDCEDTQLIVHSDSGLLERVLENFVTNAIRYTEHGQVSIICRSSDDVVQISVTDTGVGIPQGDTERVFEEYYQLDNQVRDRRKGLGLGLSIVKHIAKLLDHSILVESELGKGSVFSIKVPLGSPLAVPTDLSTAQHRDNTRRPIVLFVDDDPAIIDATSLLLCSSNIEVFTGLCGDEALAHLANGVRPDMLVSDFRLPGYDGIEVARRVRRTTTDSLPVVIMTGDTSAEKIQAANLSDCTVLKKPVDTDRLIALIESSVADSN